MQNMLFGLTYDQIQEMSDEFFKRPPKPEKISAQQAHEVAMIAAMLIQPSAMDDATHKEAASMVAEAYLQAYEAIEGWTKAQVGSIPVKETPAKTVSIYRNGNFFSVTFNGKDEAGMNFLIGDYQTATFTLPKDA